MAFMLVITAVLSLAVLAIWWPDMPGRPTLRVLSWAAIFGVVWHRNYCVRIVGTGAYVTIVQVGERLTGMARSQNGWAVLDERPPSVQIVPGSRSRSSLATSRGSWRASLGSSTSTWSR
jgi:hypothetical protein